MAIDKKSKEVNRLQLSESWTRFNEDGSIKDFGIKTFYHNESYAQWNDVKND